MVQQSNYNNFRFDDGPKYLKANFSQIIVLQTPELTAVLDWIVNQEMVMSCSINEPTINMGESKDSYKL